MPSPNVDSAVIRIDLNKKSELTEEQEKFFFRVVKAGFSQRRKTMANSIASLMGIGKSAVYSVLSELGLPEAARIEQLSMEQLMKFSVMLMEQTKE